MVLYYSHSKKTKLFAEALGEVLGQSVYGLESDLDRRSGLGFLTHALYLTFTGKDYAIANMPDSVPDEIYLCCPVWGGQIAAPARHFLENMDLKGKRVNILLTASVPVDKYRQKAAEYLNSKISCNAGEVYIFASSNSLEKETIKEHLRELLPNM